MSTDYGTDVLALEDLLDPEQLVSGDLNVAYALARRLLTESGALEEIGETEEYDSLDVRDWLGGRLDQAALDDLQSQATQVLSRDERVLTVDVSVTYAVQSKAIRLSASGEGVEGPFQFVLSVDGVTVQLLRGG